MNDLISRQAAVKAVEDLPNCYNGYSDTYDKACIIGLLEELPPAQERKKGEWILVKGSNGKDYHKCSECLHTQDITGVKNYCAVCGADMGGKEDETD